MKKFFFNRVSSSKKLREESPYYSGNTIKKTKPGIQSSRASSVQSNFSRQEGKLVPSSSEDQEAQLTNTGVTVTGYEYLEEKQSPLDSDVPSSSVTEGEGTLNDQSDMVKSGFEENDSSKLPITNDDSSSAMTENHIAPPIHSLDSKVSSGFYSIHEIIQAVTTSDRFQHDRTEGTKATEKKYPINTDEEFVENPFMRNDQSSQTQGTFRTWMHNILLARSAAFFYKPEAVQSEDSTMCDRIRQVNEYLRASRTEVEAGLPGKFLCIVIGKELPDLGSIVSAITYAYFLKVTSKSNQICTVPVINMKRADLPLFPEVEWLFESCCIDQGSLIFIDEINLSYYHQFGSLKIKLVNNHRLSVNQEIYKGAAVEVLDCKKVDSIYPWVNCVHTEEVGSCCTLVAEKIVLSSPTILAGNGLSRILLAGLLLDTANLTSHQCTTKDKCMATLLIKGARQAGRNDFFLFLKHKMFDMSNMKTTYILRKNFKDWNIKFGKPIGFSFNQDEVYVGMSCVGVSINELLIREFDLVEEIISFMKTQKLYLLVIVTGYYDNLQKFKRELIFAGEEIDAVNRVVHFFNTNGLCLAPKQIHPSGFQDSIKAFNMDDTIISRNRIERLLEEFLAI